MAKQHAGRPPTPITGEFLTSEPSLLQAVIISKKNNGGKPRSWQAVADEIGEEIGETFSGALMYRIAKGEIESDKVEQALGIKPKTAPAPVCTNPACKGYGEPHVFDCQTQAVIEKPLTPATKAPRPKRKPSPDDTVSFTVKMKRHERDAINETAKGRGITVKDMIFSDYLGKVNDV